MTYIVRMVETRDLDALVELAGLATHGLTTLSPDPERLSDRITKSEAREAPLLVMVESATGDVVGTSGIVARAATLDHHEPFYAYRLERTVHQSSALKVRTEVEALHLVKSFEGPTELGTLFLHPEHRKGGVGRLLSLSRFLLMARYPEWFENQVIVELRGVIDEAGHSPFWEAVGRHFFKVEYPQADELSARDKGFIAELMPTHPIYLPLLPGSAREVIGQVHPDTAPAKKLLEGEGFYFADMVDIFDAGPCLRCDRSAVRTIREAKTLKVVGWLDEDEQVSGARPTHLVASAAGDFVCGASAVELTEDGEGVRGVRLSVAMREAGLFSEGDAVWVSPWRSGSQ